MAQSAERRRIPAAPTHKRVAGRPAGAGKSRKTQAERSDAMRQRLVDATLACLAKDGYAGTTISKIVARAKVSHGATGHHFQAKSDLILAAAEELTNRVYRLLEGLVGITGGEDRLATLMDALWTRFHSQSEMKALLTIMVAAQGDKALAKAVADLTHRTETMFDLAASLLFEAVPGSQQSPHSLFVLTRTQLLGLAAQFHSGTPEQEIREQIDAWVRLMASQFRARHDIVWPIPSASTVRE